MLSDQGRLEEAESLLRRALQVWRGTADEHGVAFATPLLGRLHARAGDTEGAVQLLEDALARFEALRVEVDAALVKTLLAEAELFDGRAEEAYERAHALLDETPEDTMLEPLLRHLKGVALAQMGEICAARTIAGALDAARAADCRSRRPSRSTRSSSSPARRGRGAASSTSWSSGSTSPGCPGRRWHARGRRPRGRLSVSAARVAEAGRDEDPHDGAAPPAGERSWMHGWPGPASAQSNSRPTKPSWSSPSRSS